MTKYLMAFLTALFAPALALAQYAPRGCNGAPGNGAGWGFLWIVVAAVMIAALFWGYSTSRRRPPTSPPRSM